EAAAAREAVARVAGGPRPLRLDDGAGADAPPAHQDISSETKPAGAPPIRVLVLENPRRLGRGPSVQRGLGAAGGDLLIVLSADLNIPLAESFAAVQEYLRDPEGTGFILGNRRSLKRPRHGVRAPLKKLFDDIEHDKASGLEVPDPTSP